MPNSSVADRNLLFGVLAMQMNFVGRDALINGMNAWIRDKKKPLGNIFLDQGALTAAQHQVLDNLVAAHLQAHGDDPQWSLQALSTQSWLWPPLVAIDDAELQASIHNLTKVTRNASTVTENRSATNIYPETVRNGSRYRIVRFHKHGGLGNIYVAEDDELHREVALKEIKPERADDPSSRGRFVFEAEITGGLDHPGIVPVHGFGVYPDGRPYYAMRFIRGESLKEAIEHFHKADRPSRDPRERSLAFRQLLRRFNDVCNAVAYAHSRGVLHRDIKPANIMLGKFGETLVVDWGLAKVGVEQTRVKNFDPDATADAALRPTSGTDVLATLAGAAMGTPTYMSPEQAAGQIDELGLTSDIYSLGATFYVLLTGEKPFQGEDANEVLKQVKLGQFAPPGSVKSQVPAPLDAICRKAMALQPADRYSSVPALAADVEHWLADEPIEVYREPLLVRAGRWARRHKTPVVAFAVFLLSAVVALSASTVLIWNERKKTEEQARIAQANYGMARDLSANSIELIAANEAEFASIPELHTARKKALKSAAHSFRVFLKQEPNDVELRTRAARVFLFTANVDRLTFDTKEAEELYREALRLSQELASEFPGDRDRQLMLTSVRIDFGNFRYNIGRLAEAKENIDRGIKEIEKMREDGGDSLPLRAFLGRALLDKSNVQHDCGENEDARKSANRAIELLEKIPLSTARPYDTLFLAAALNKTAVLDREEKKLIAARETHRKVTELLEPWKNNPPQRISKNDFHNWRARFQLHRTRTAALTAKNPETAEKNFTLLIAQWKNLAAPFPDVPMFRDSMAETYFHRGQHRAQTRKPAADVRSDFEQSRDIYQKLIDDYPEVIGYKGKLGRVYLELARLARDSDGNRNESISWLNEAEKMLKEATERSPDNAEDRKSLEELIAEK